VKNGKIVMHVMWASGTQQTDIVSTAAKDEGEEDGGENDRKIHTAARRLHTSQKHAAITNHFSK
jgi:hypothetical protein